MALAANGDELTIMWIEEMTDLDTEDVTAAIYGYNLTDASDRTTTYTAITDNKGWIRNIERDISLGVSPAAALGVRLTAAKDYLSGLSELTDLDVANEGGRGSIPSSQRRPRKP